MRQVRLDTQAKDDLADAVLYYEQRRKGLGREFLEKFLKGVRAIETFPAGYQIKFDPYRCYNFDRFPYGIVYDFNDEEIYIIAIRNHYREPGHWAKRLK